MKYLLALAALFTSICLYSQKPQPADEIAFKKGIVKYNSKDYKGAIVDFSKAATLNPKMVGAFFHRAKCKQFLEDYKGAVEDYTKVIKLKATYAEAYTARGISKYISLSLAGTPEDYAQRNCASQVIAFTTNGRSREQLLNGPFLRPVIWHTLRRCRTQRFFQCNLHWLPEIREQ